MHYREDGVFDELKCLKIAIKTIRSAIVAMITLLVLGTLTYEADCWQLTGSINHKFPARLKTTHIHFA